MGKMTETCGQTEKNTGQHRQTDKQTEGQTKHYGQRDRRTDRGLLSDRQTKATIRPTEGQTDIHYVQTDRRILWAYRLKDRNTEHHEQTDRHTHRQNILARDRLKDRQNTKDRQT